MPKCLNLNVNVNVKKVQISSFIKIRPVGAELFHADRRTLRSINSRFSQFANAPNNGKVAPVNDKKTYRWSGGTDALILNLGNRWRWVVNSTPRRTYPREGTRYSLNRSLGGPQSRSGSFWEEKKKKEKKNSCSIPGFEPRTAEHVT